MFKITSNTRRPGGKIGRRDFLHVGAASALGLSIPHLLHAQAAGAGRYAETFGRAKRCIFTFLNGGPSQLDTWDMKPNATAEIRGELKPISTNVPGIQVSELFPQTAKQVDKFKIVRSVSHTCSVHTTGVYTMLTGNLHPTPKVDQTRALPKDHPHVGSIVSKWRGWSNQMPPFVTLPTLFEAPPVTGIWPGQNAGFLGKSYDPFVVRGNKQTAEFTLPEIQLPTDLNIGRLQDRKSLLDQLNQSFEFVRSNQRLQQQVADRGVLSEQALSLLSSGHVQQAFNLDHEDAKIRDGYGRHLFGQGLLLARRLIEADVPLVTIYWIDPTPAGEGGGEYDSHGRIYHHMRNRLVPPTDQALSALFEDLSERGLLEDTLVVVLGEFGRTPRINAAAGRDHWPQVQSILMAGAGITGGSVYGASDKIAAYPALDPVSPPELTQTILHLLGIPPDFELHDQTGRAFRACQGNVVSGLLS